MKSVHCVMIQSQFDTQYNIDLDGFMTPREFASKINAFNQVAKQYPPPPSLSSKLSATIIACFSTLVIVTVITSIHYTHHLIFILAIPFTLLLFSSILIGWRSQIKKKFEKAMYTCTLAMNATDNVRGINFRITTLTPDYLNHKNWDSSINNNSGQYQPTAYYAIAIEFDERYNLLHHFTSPHTQSSYLSEPSPPYKSSSSSSPSSSLPPPSYSPSPPPNSYQPNEKL